jgi:hypothetical protein
MKFLGFILLFFGWIASGTVDTIEVYLTMAVGVALLINWSTLWQHLKRRPGRYTCRACASTPSCPLKRRSACLAWSGPVTLAAIAMQATFM